MEKKVLELIEFLKKTTKVCNVYVGKSIHNKFYYDVNGYAGNKYYDIVLKQEIVSGKFIVYKSHNTECEEALNWLLKEFGFDVQLTNCRF